MSPQEAVELFDVHLQHICENEGSYPDEETLTLLEAIEVLKEFVGMKSEVTQSGS